MPSESIPATPPHPSRPLPLPGGIEMFPPSETTALRSVGLCISLESLNLRKGSSLVLCASKSGKRRNPISVCSQEGSAGSGGTSREPGHQQGAGALAWLWRPLVGTAPDVGSRFRELLIFQYNLTSLSDQQLPEDTGLVSSIGLTAPGEGVFPREGHASFVLCPFSQFPRAELCPQLLSIEQWFWL